MFPSKGRATASEINEAILVVLVSCKQAHDSSCKKQAWENKQKFGICLII
jgi:hypothetical protein